MMRFLLAALIAAGVTGIACGDDDDTSTSETPVTTATTAETGAEPASPTDASPTDEPFEGAQDVVEEPEPDVPPLAIQTGIRVGEHSDFDRVVFDFEENSPGYVVQYVDAPILADGSGNEVEVEGHDFLLIRFLGAQAHDEAGNATVSESELMPGLPAFLEIERVGDFEGQVTWVIGLPSRLDFRVSDLTDPIRVVVDVGHPGS